MTFSRLLFLTILASGLLARQIEAQARPVKFQTHDLYVVLQPPDPLGRIQDAGTVEIQKGWNFFYINNKATITHFSIAGKAAEVLTVQPADTTTLASVPWDELPPIKAGTQAMYVFFRSSLEGVVPFRINFTAPFSDPVQDVRFSNELVGKEVAGTILEQGAYLSPAAYFYPRGDEDLSAYTVTIEIPVEWESISDGNRKASTVHNNRKIQTWENPYQSDGVIIMAAPFSVKSIRVDGIEVACYFFADDTALFDTYLPAAANYLRMYSDLIGPYPYQHFTIVENFFPTGYGMPAWTLLGREILRLPFIVYTSLGHEVLHNWWGNSVYVDYQRGNWCEAATVYGADYRYKLLRSKDAARNYRKDILKQYASYITENNDFPIRQFTARSSPD
ncbi:MAG: M1 family metallopeptidase, partial [FCB group bacterium]|nr:M1 family metallopeptidase [FCB group bacterium]